MKLNRRSVFLSALAALFSRPAKAAKSPAHAVLVIDVSRPDEPMTMVVGPGGIAHSPSRLYDTNFDTLRRMAEVARG
jgi:hypothetical protein